MKRLLDAAIADFSKVIPPEEKEKELCALVHRGTCYMHLGDFRKRKMNFGSVRKGCKSYSRRFKMRMKWDSDALTFHHVTDAAL